MLLIHKTCQHSTYLYHQRHSTIILCSDHLQRNSFMFLTHVFSSLHCHSTTLHYLTTRKCLYYDTLPFRDDVWTTVALRFLILPLGVKACSPPSSSLSPSRSFMWCWIGCNRVLVPAGMTTRSILKEMISDLQLTSAAETKTVF